MSADDDLIAAVRSALDGSTDLDAWDVEVSAVDGVVTLAGEVGCAAERLAARTLAVATPGVAALRDEISVRQLDDDWRLDDVQIADRVSARLAARADLGGVSASCAQRVVHLRGTVPDEASRRIAHHLARSTQGVHFIVDRLATTV